MAENIVESIIVKLGLDGSQYNSEAKKAKDSNDKLNKSVSETDQVVGKVTGTIAKWFSALAVGTGVLRMIDQVQKLNDELYHLEKNLGMSATTIKGWQGAASAMGGSADGMTSSMKGLNKSMNDFVVRGDASMLEFTNALGVSFVDMNGKLRDTDKVMLDLADSFSKMDREQAFSLASDMGIDEGTFNTLVQGRKEMEKMLEYQSKIYKSSEEELKVSRQLAQNRALLGTHWESLKMMMANAIMPLFVKLSEVALGIFEYLQENQQAVQAVFKGISFVIGAILIPILAKATLAALAFIAPFAPFILVVGALGAAFGLLYDDYKTWAEGGKSLFDWGAFRDYIDNSTLSTNNLRNAFNNLTKDMISGVIPTLKGYADIVRLLSQGQFKAAGALAADMLVNFGERVGNVIDDVTGNKQGSFIESGRNMVGGLFGGREGSSSVSVGGYSGGSNPLLELLNKGETGGKSGAAAYSTAFTGMRIKAPKPLTEMTIGEIKEWQRANINEQKSRGLPADKRSSAAGRYQIIYTSMGGYQKGAGLKDSDLFSQENQDKMAMAMMRSGKYGLDAVKAGKATPDQFLDKILSPQWASVQNSQGRGIHDKAGFNKATITPAQSRRAIQEYLGMSSISAQQSMRQTDVIDLTRVNANKGVAAAANSTEVTVGQVTINTSSPTMTGTGQDLASGIQNQFYQFQNSMK